MCSLNKWLFMNREFPLTAVRILAGKTFSFERNASINVKLLGGGGGGGRPRA